MILDDTQPMVSHLLCDMIGFLPIVLPESRKPQPAAVSMILTWNRRAHGRWDSPSPMQMVAVPPHTNRFLSVPIHEFLFRFELPILLLTAFAIHSERLPPLFMEPWAFRCRFFQLQRDEMGIIVTIGIFLTEELLP